MTTLVLASASPARRAVLQAAGVEPVVRVSAVDEDAVLAGLATNTPADAAVVELAAAKAHAVATGPLGDPANDCVVVGCDSMLLIDGELQGKPGSIEVARQRWQRMAGHSGVLWTGHCVLRLRDGEITNSVSAADATTVWFGNPDPDDLEAYLVGGEPLAVAGAFTLDGYGGWFVDRIEGAPSNVIGISLPLLRGLLVRVGMNLNQLWSPTPAAC